MLSLPAGGGEGRGTARSLPAVSLMVGIYYCLRERHLHGVGVSIALLDGMLHHRAGLYPLLLNNRLGPEDLHPGRRISL